MIKKTLYFGSPCYLCKKEEQLIVKFADESKKNVIIPIEDIGIVILDNPQITLTHALMVALSENNAAVISCNGSHLPYSLMLPMHSHHAFTEKMSRQIESSLPLRKNMWMQTVVAKIRNQAALLNALGEDNKRLLRLAEKVKSGDPENVEGQAASYYWDRLFILSEGFMRHRSGPPPNNLLNYGYAVLRAVIARNLSASGLFLALGIHHHNKYNPYCLADDIMEPFRPFVDALVLEVMQEQDDISELTPGIKKKLLSVPTVDIRIDGEKSPLMVGAQRTSASVAACFEGSARKILYPETPF